MTTRTNLVEQNIGLAQVIAFDYANIPGITLSDAVSEANCALLRASEGFEQARGEFTPYAARVIRNALNSLYAKQLRMARVFPRSLDEPPSGGADTGGSDAVLHDRPVDVAMLTDEVTHITKFFGDWHLARVYLGARDRFYLDQWRMSVEQRLGPTR